MGEVALTVESGVEVVTSQRKVCCRVFKGTGTSDIFDSGLLTEAVVGVGNVGGAVGIINTYEFSSEWGIVVSSDEGSCITP